MVKLRLSTSIMPEANTKETRIKLTMSSFTFTLFPDTQWISDLASFAKNPPGVCVSLYELFTMDLIHEFT